MAGRTELAVTGRTVGLRFVVEEAVFAFCAHRILVFGRELVFEADCALSSLGCDGAGVAHREELHAGGTLLFKVVCVSLAAAEPQVVRVLSTGAFLAKLLTSKTLIRVAGADLVWFVKYVSSVGGVAFGAYVFAFALQAPWMKLSTRLAKAILQEESGRTGRAVTILALCAAVGCWALLAFRDCVPILVESLPERVLEHALVAPSGRGAFSAAFIVVALSASVV